MTLKKEINKAKEFQGKTLDVSWIQNGRCINAGQSMCNLGYACDGCPYNKDSIMLQKEISDIEKQKEELEQRRKDALVSEGKAYRCIRCKSFVDKDDISPVALKKNLCRLCFNREWQEHQKKEILDKLKFAKIVDIEINRNEITLLVVHKNGMSYELKPVYDSDFDYDDGASIIIDHESRDHRQIEDDENPKPWMKERPEPYSIADDMWCSKEEYDRLVEEEKKRKSNG
jgi:hypothetical protein